MPAAMLAAPSALVANPGRTSASAGRSPGAPALAVARAAARGGGLATASSGWACHGGRAAGTASRRLAAGVVRSMEGEEMGETSQAPAAPAAPVMGPRDDDVLPDSLDDALAQAAECTIAAMRGGGARCIVEVLIPELWDPISGAVCADEGDNMRLWEINRVFAATLVREMGLKTVMVVPDAGQAAYLKNLYGAACTFDITSLNDRRIIEPGTEVVVIASPDPQGLEGTKKACKQAQQEAEERGDTAASVVMINPRLASGDVGIGLNVRRMRDEFTSTFTTTYSLRPLEEYGTVFRRYPDMWKVFLADQEVEGRFNLIAERSSRPAGDVLDNIIMAAVAPVGEDGVVEEPGMLQQLAGIAGSMSRFMKSLSQ